MSDDRAQILAAIRASLGRSANEAEAAVDARLADPRPNLVPARAQVDSGAQVALFVAMAEEASATVARVARADDVPQAVAGYLAEHNLPAEAVIAPDPALDALPWESAPLLELRKGRAQGPDAVGITGAFAGVAETGTLMLLSGPEHPSTLHSLPDTHIVVLRRDRVVGAYEDGWARLRARAKGMPRTVTFVTGPSRTADIEQTIQLGAHGPRRLHIVLVDGAAQDA
ncbi:MAG: lactate utilization protein C [Alphaproteobacteria bacterium]